MKKIVVGTRGSKLALAQTGQVVDVLRDLYPQYNFEIKIIKTKGDVYKNSLKNAPERGLFTKEIELALLDGRIDMAVHSYKDMEVKEADGLMVAAILKREDVRDVLITGSGKKFDEIERGIIVGTGSPRRMSQLERFGFKFKDIRGNVDTRLMKLEKGEYDGIVLAISGLKRLGFKGYEKFAIPVDVLIPSPGQAALSIEIRKDDDRLRDLLKPLNHMESEIGVKLEKKFLEKMGGGCHLPIGAYAKVNLTERKLNFMVFFEEKGVKYRSKLNMDYESNILFDKIFNLLMKNKEVVL